MNFRQRQIVMALLAVEGVGRRTVRKILKKCKQKQFSLEEVWQHSNKLCSDFVCLNKTQIENISHFKKKYSVSSYSSYLKDKGIEAIFEDDSQYPSQLRHIDDKPLVLFAKGDLGFVHIPSVAVVGTRKMTHYGKLATERIVSDLVESEFVIVSGAMYGVDTFAHQVCQKLDGKTIGVLGFGFNHCFPARHRFYLEEIIEKGGCLITEFPPDVSPRAGNFPQRNRIVAGMSWATIVIEAGSNSGSLITAQLAAEYGREVCAVPGPFYSPYSQGIKELLNQGARLITSGTEIISQVAVMHGIQVSNHEKTCNSHMKNNTRNAKKIRNTARPSINIKLSPVEERIVSVMKQTHTSFDSICEAIHIPAHELSAVLTRLEMKGVVTREGQMWLVK